MKIKTKEYLLAIAACLLWSTAFTAIKLGSKAGVDINIFAGMRFMLSGGMLLPFALKFRISRRDYFYSLPGALLIGFVHTFMLYALFYWGLTYVKGSIAAIIVGASPLFAAVMSHFMLKSEPLSRRKLQILTVGFVGIIILSLNKEGSEAGLKAKLIGITLLVTSTAVSILANIIAAKLKSKLNPIQMNSIQLSFGGFLLALLGAAQSGLPKLMSLSPAFYGTLIWLAFVSAAACSLWFTALRLPETKVSNLNVWKFLIPVFGSSLSWLVFADDNPTVLTVIGMIWVATSVFAYNKFGEK